MWFINMTEGAPWPKWQTIGQEMSFEGHKCNHVCCLHCGNNHGSPLLLGIVSKMIFTGAKRQVSRHCSREMLTHAQEKTKRNGTERLRGQQRENISYTNCTNHKSTAWNLLDCVRALNFKEVVDSFAQKLVWSLWWELIEVEDEIQLCLSGTLHMHGVIPTLDSR